MHTFTVKNIHPDLYKKLKRSAQANRRSINNEIIVCIERAVSSQRVDLDDTLARARKLREITFNTPISDDEFTQAKVAGRP